MKSWSAAALAQAAHVRLLADPRADGGPKRIVIDSRAAGPGDLFVGLTGANTDGGRFAADALAAGAWGVLAANAHLEPLVEGAGGALLAAEDPLVALGLLARAWRRELAAKVVAITGSTGKTSTKDILAALLAPTLSTVASAQNRNTEIGLPLAILEAPAGTQALVLELAMRAPGQIAELTAICEPDVGVIVNVGPAHLERLGSVEAIAAAKAELIAGLRAGACAVLPASERLLEPHLREDIEVIRFGDGGDVSVLEARGDGVAIALRGRRVVLEPGFRSVHLLEDLCAALAASSALGVEVSDRQPLEVAFSALRGERLALPGGVLVINDCYNANPMSMRAALQELATTATARRVAVLGDMLELGRADEERYHRELGEQASVAGVELLVTVGPRAAWAGDTFAGGEHVHAADADGAVELLAKRLRPGDTVLVKGSRGVALERVAERLAPG